MKQPQFIEDKANLENQIREMIYGKIKLPKFARDDLA